MSFSCADNERYNDALVALAEGKNVDLSAIRTWGPMAEFRVLMRRACDDT